MNQEQNQSLNKNLNIRQPIKTVINCHLEKKEMIL